MSEERKQPAGGRHIPFTDAEKARLVQMWENYEHESGESERKAFAREVVRIESQGGGTVSSESLTSTLKHLGRIKRHTREVSEDKFETFCRVFKLSRLQLMNRISDRRLSKEVTATTNQSTPEFEKNSGPAKPGDLRLIEIPVPLPSGNLAYFRMPKQMTEADFIFYQAVLAAYKPGIVGIPPKGPGTSEDEGAVE